MTTYILHGGVPKGQTQFLIEMSFWEEIMKRVSKPTRILCVYSAIDPDRWEAEFKSEQELMAVRMQPDTYKLELGSLYPSQLAEQIKRADAIYIRGGNNELAISSLTKMSNLEKLFEGKVVAGSSAGAHVLSRYFRSRQKEIQQGLGLIQCKTIMHYSDELKVQAEGLRGYGEDVPLYTLREGEYVVIEV
jgi:peptidase E